MEISLVNSSCRNLQLSSSSSSSPFHHHHRFIINNGRNSPTTRTRTTTILSLTKLNHFHSKSPTNLLFNGRSLRRVCALSDTEIPGVETTVLESAQSLAMKNKAIDISPELKGTSIFLIGMKSTMKTNLAKVLAELLKYYYFDSDKLVEEAAGGESAAKNFRENDESGFRASETEVLKQLSSMGRLVVCAGDGAVESSTNLSFLRYGVSIWIDVPLDMLAAEVIESQGPPSILDPSSEVVANLRKQYLEIKDGYATADALISVQKLAYKLGYEDIYSVTTEDMALETLKEIEKLTRVKKMMESAAKPF